MMYRQLIFIAVVVPFVFSCCIPEQWQGFQSVAIGQVQDGKPSAVEALYNVSFDAVSKKVVLAGVVLVDDKEINEIVLQDFAAGKQYVVVNGLCTVKQLTDPFPPSCTPPDAKMLLSTFYGVGQEKIMVELYEFHMPDKKVEFTVTKGSCVPVSTNAKGIDQIMLLNYMGITPGIMNMTVFDVPKQCLHVASVQTADHLYLKQTVFFQ